MSAKPPDTPPANSPPPQPDDAQGQTDSAQTPSISLILGGARSGKSRYAEELAATCGNRLYLATAVFDIATGDDKEMTARIAQHKLRRGEHWQTIEEPLEIDKVIKAESRPDNIILIDCLTIWLSNLLYHERDIEAHTSRLLESLSAAPGDILMVSNEVGLSIVPENALARRFRDEQGRLNQTLAKAAHNVVFIAAGLPLTLKGSAS